MSDSRARAAEARRQLVAVIEAADPAEQLYEIRSTLNALGEAATSEMAVRGCRATRFAFRVVAGRSDGDDVGYVPLAVVGLLNELCETLAGTKAGAALDVARSAFIAEVQRDPSPSKIKDKVSIRFMLKNLSTEGQDLYLDVPTSVGAKASVLASEGFAFHVAMLDEDGKKPPITAPREAYKWMTLTITGPGGLRCMSEIVPMGKGAVESAVEPVVRMVEKLYTETPR